MSGDYLFGDVDPVPPGAPAHGAVMVRAFCTPAGRQALSWMACRALGRRVPGDEAEGVLRGVEGQRAMLAEIVTMIERTRHPGAPRHWVEALAALLTEDAHDRPGDHDD